MRPLFRLVAWLALVMQLAGCMTGLRSPLETSGVSSADLTLTVQPELQTDLQAQTVFQANTRSSISRLDVLLCVQTAPGTFQPLSATSGQPTTYSDPQILKVTLNQPYVNGLLSKPVAFHHLQPRTYRIVAQAYNASGVLISTADSRCWVEVTLANDNRPALPATLPVALVNTPFAAQVTISADFAGVTDQIRRVEVKLYRSVGGTDLPVENTAATYSTTDFPRTLTLMNLQANITYRLHAEAWGDGASPIGSTDLMLPVTNNDLLGTMALSLPAAPVGTLVGTVSGFKDGWQDEALFKQPDGLALDPVGNLYICDRQNYRIRMLSNWGRVETFAGGPYQGWSNGPKGTGTFQDPVAIALDASGTLFVTEAIYGCVRRLEADGTLSSWAGTPMTYGFAQDYASTSSALFSNVEGIAIDRDGTMVVADTTNNCVRVIEASGSVWNPYITEGSHGYGPSSYLRHPHGLALDGDGNLFVADTDNHCIRKVNLRGHRSNGALFLTATTFAGSGSPGFADGQGSSAAFKQPWGLAYDPDTQILYVADCGNNRIRRIDRNGWVSTLAGSEAGYADGVGSLARFNGPHSLVLTPSKDLLVSDTGNARIRKVGQPPSAPDRNGVTSAVSFGSVINPNQVCRVEVTTADSTSLNPGDSVNLKATAYNARGQVVSTDWSWARTDNQVNLNWRGNFWKTGLDTARWNTSWGFTYVGVATVTAIAANGVQGSLPITINNLPPSITAKQVNPVVGGPSTSDDVTVAANTLITFTAEIRDPNGFLVSTSSNIQAVATGSAVLGSLIWGYRFDGEIWVTSATFSATFPSAGSNEVQLVVRDGTSFRTTQTWQVTVQ